MRRSGYTLKRYTNSITISHGAQLRDLLLFFVFHSKSDFRCCVNHKNDILVRTYISYESINDTTRCQIVIDIFNYFEEHDTCRIKIYDVTSNEVKPASYLNATGINYLEWGTNYSKKGYTA